MSTVTIPASNSWGVSFATGSYSALSNRQVGWVTGASTKERMGFEFPINIANSAITVTQVQLVINVEALVSPSSIFTIGNIQNGLSSYSGFQAAFTDIGNAKNTATLASQTTTGSKTITLASGIVTFVQNNNGGYIYLGMYANTESGGTSNTVTLTDYTGASAGIGSAPSLVVTYTVNPFPTNFMTGAM